MRLSQAEDDRKQAQKNKVFRARQKRRSDTALFCYPEATNSDFCMTDGKDTAAKTKSLISKENARHYTDNTIRCLLTARRRTPHRHLRPAAASFSEGAPPGAVL